VEKLNFREREGMIVHMHFRCRCDRAFRRVSSGNIIARGQGGRLRPRSRFREGAGACLDGWAPWFGGQRPSLSIRGIPLFQQSGRSQPGCFYRWIIRSWLNRHTRFSLGFFGGEDCRHLKLRRANSTAPGWCLLD